MKTTLASFIARALVAACATPLLHAAAPAAADAPTPVDTKIDAVTVYPDRALVSRVARFDLASGDVRIRIANLPARLTDRSVRVVVGGSASPTLVGFSLAAVPASEEVSPVARELEAKIKNLEASDRSLQSDYQQVGDQRGFLTSLRSTFDPKAAAKEKHAVDPKAWGATDDYLGSELLRLLGEARRIQAERRALAKELALLRKRMEQLRGKRGTTTKALTLDLRAARAGRGTLTLRYLVPDSSWRSLYDARLNVKGGEVDFLHYALVTQESGEDWDDVKLSVSTAVPSRHIALPTLVGRNLGVGGHYPSGNLKLDSSMTRTPQSKSTSTARGEKKEREHAVPPPAPEAEARQAEFVTTYDAATRVSVPSSPAGRKTAVGKQKLTARLEHVAVPARAQGAYLTAVGVIPQLAPLPAGEVSLFFGDEYVGATNIAQVVPGGELRLPFGRDERLRVRRVQVERRREEQGIFSKRERHNLRYEIRIENQTGHAVDLIVLDQHPVAQHTEISVELAEDTTPRAPVEPSDGPGVLRWKLALPTGATTALKLGYAVSHPMGQRIYGSY